MITDNIQIANLYASLMEEVKLRIFNIEHATSNKTGLTPQFVNEFCYLQLRMIGELIALGCLVIHGDIAATQSNKFQKEYSADSILAMLEPLHRNFFPSPVTVVVIPEENRVELQEPSPGYITKEELIKLIRDCGGQLHRGSMKKILSPVKQETTDFSEVVTRTNSIVRRLESHKISTLDNRTHFICILSNASDNNRVQVAVAQSPSLA